MDPLRIGILGAARITPAALTLPAEDNDDVELSVVAARDPERARTFAAEHGVARVAASYQDVIDDPDIDAVYNPLPINLHASWSIAALRAGKHVLCEKPFAMNADEARSMVAVAEETGLVLMEAFHWRYHPVAAAMRAVVDSGDLGPIETVDAAFCVPIPDTTDIRHQLDLGGGSLMDLGCYPVQWVRHLAGGTPEVSTASAVEGLPGIDLSIEAGLRWPSGVTGTVACSMAPDTGFRAMVTVVGADGTMSVMNPLAPHLGGSIRVQRPGHESVETPHDPRATYAHQLDAFVDAVAGRRAAVTGGTDAIESMVVIDAIYRAAGLPIRSSDPTRRGDSTTR